MVELGLKLRELRTAKGLTQGQVAERIGVTASVVSAYEKGIRQPSYEALIKLTALYHVSSDYLLGIAISPITDSQNVVSLDGLTPSKMKLVRDLVEALKDS